MKKNLQKIAITVLGVVLIAVSVNKVKAQTSLSDQEYVAVTMDLQGILQLTMTTDPQVDFVFNTIQKHQIGITKYNATRLEVDATVPWDLYAQPTTEFWTPELAYGLGTNG